MFCPGCGLQNADDVSFCKRCGERVKPRRQEGKEFSLLVNRFLTTIGTVSVVGLGLPIMVVLSLGKRGFQPEALFLIAVSAFCATVLIDSLLVWLMLRVMKMRQAEEIRNQSLPERITNSLSPAQSSAPSLFSSVTEHTTRDFDPAIAKRAKAYEWKGD